MFFFLLFAFVFNKNGCGECFKDTTTIPEQKISAQGDTQILIERLLVWGILCKTRFAFYQHMLISVVIILLQAFNRDLACGSTKGCFGDCIGDGSSCTYLIAWKSTNTTVMFTIQVEGSFTSDMYVSFGLSPTQNMV